MGLPRFTLALLLVLLIALPSLAKTTLDVQAGYDDRFRPGRWSPVIITVSHDRPITGRLDVRVANASDSVMTIRQRVGVGTQKQTYVVYAPLSMLFDPVRVTLADDSTGKLLAEWPDNNPGAVNTRFGMGGEQVGFFALTTGRAPVMQGMVYDRGGGTTIVSHQPASMLPVTPVGYDSIDLLYLNNPAWGSLSNDQQNAIVAWIRAGGHAILWPGVEPLQSDAPLVSILPAAVGDVTSLALDRPALQKAGLSDRFGSIAKRTLTPITGARGFGVLDNNATGFTYRVGLGTMTVMPIDGSVLQFNDTDAFRRFWRNVLGLTIDFKASGGTGANEKKQPRSSYEQAAEVDAAHDALGYIGDIPDAGAFQFSYILIVIGLLMLVVGPIDFFILKKIGRQPWTWMTTLGWIGLVTIGALYAGHLLRSGNLYYRTMRLVEQTSDQVVSQNEVALVYAPRSATYAVDTDPTSWWQPVPIGNRGYGGSGSGFSLPLRLHQDYRGTQPEPMWIDVWGWKFIQGKKIGTAAPMLSAKLKRNGNAITGTLINLTPHPLKQIQIAYGDVSAKVETACEAGSSVDISAELRGAKLGIDGSPFQVRNEPHAAQVVGKYPGDEEQGPLRYADLFALNRSESEAISRLKGTDTVVIYALVDGADPATTLTDSTAVQLHRTMLRAVIELQP